MGGSRKQLDDERVLRIHNASGRVDARGRRAVAHERERLRREMERESEWREREERRRVRPRSAGLAARAQPRRDATQRLLQPFEERVRQPLLLPAPRARRGEQPQQRRPAAVGRQVHRRRARLVGSAHVDAGALQQQRRVVVQAQPGEQVLAAEVPTPPVPAWRNPLKNPLSISAKPLTG